MKPTKHHSDNEINDSLVMLLMIITGIVLGIAALGIIALVAYII